MTREKAEQLRAMIVNASASLGDADALEAVELFPQWQGNGSLYPVGTRVRFTGGLYRCLQEHLSQADWTPTASPSLWAKLLIPDPDEIPDWEQPDSTNAYRKGDRVRHKGKVWRSDYDNNIWEPGVYGWSELP